MNNAVTAHRRISWSGELSQLHRGHLAEWVGEAGAPDHVGWVPAGLAAPACVRLVASAIAAEQAHAQFGFEHWHGFSRPGGAWAVAIYRGGHRSPVWWSCASGSALWREIADLVALELECHVMNEIRVSSCSPGCDQQRRIRNG